MSSFLLTLLLFIAPSAAPAADDHLIAWSPSVEREMRDLLIKEPEAYAQMVAFPARESERAVFLTRPKGSPPVVTLRRVVDRPLRTMMYGQIEKDSKASKLYKSGPSVIKKALKKISPKLLETKAQISEATADRLIDAWQAVLAQTVKSPPPENMTDGQITYYFANGTKNFGLTVEETKLPAAKTKVLALVALGEKLVRYVETKETAEQDRLDKELRTEAEGLLRTFKALKDQ